MLVFAQGLGAAVEHDLAVRQHVAAVGDLERQLHVLLDEQDGTATLVGERPHHRQQPLDDHRGEPQAELVQQLFEILRGINKSDRIGMLLVEQNAAMALDLADHACVVETGRMVLSGTAAELKRDDAVRRSYLGY